MNERSGPPLDFRGLRALIVERGRSLPKRLVQVAEFALQHPDEIAFGTVASIAAAAEVQPSTLVRFSQALGYQGFSDLQDIFRSQLRERILNYDERMQQLREHAASVSRSHVMFQGFVRAAETSLAALRSEIDPDRLDRAVERLSAARSIYLLGLRRSFPISTYMAYALGKLGVPHVLVQATGGLGAEEMSFASPGDAVLAVSFTPYASETVDLARAAHARQVPVVAITDSGLSPLNALADPCFEINEANFEGFRSLAAAMVLAMTLTVAVAARREGNGGLLI